MFNLLIKKPDKFYIEPCLVKLNYLALNIKKLLQRRKITVIQIQQVTQKFKLIFYYMYAIF